VLNAGAVTALRVNGVFKFREIYFLEISREILQKSLMKYLIWGKLKKKKNVFSTGIFNVINSVSFSNFKY